MNYALIENGIVTNMIYLHPMNAEDFPGAVAVGALPVAIGDEYRDGKFWRDGVEVVAAEASTGGESSEEAADMEEALRLLGVEA